MNIVKLGLAVVTATMIGTAAQAGALVHDTPGEFSSIVVNQGTLVDGSPITDPTRTDFNNVFDNNANTFFSLGLGGEVALTIAPSGRSISGGTVIEITNIGNQIHKEAVEILLGKDGGSLVSVGFFFNSDTGGGTAGADTADPTIALLSAVNFPGGDGGEFFIEIVSGSYNTIVFRDASGLNDLAEGQLYSGIGSPSSTDGFDIGELSVTSVPEPGTLALLGAGLFGLAGFARRKAA